MELSKWKVILMNSIRSFITKCTLFLLLCVGTGAQAANVVFDIGDVILTTKKFTAMQQIGFWNIIAFGKNPRPLFFKYMHQVTPRLTDAPGACDEEGNPLPQLMVDWMIGNKTNAAIAQEFRDALDKDTVLTNAQYKMLHRLSFIFDDVEAFIKTKKVVNKTFRFIKECKQNGHKVYILSNWDAESIKVARNKYPELFNLFDGAIVSGEVHLMKPNPEIYQLLLDTYNLKAEDTIFIDDQLENIIGAQSKGIAGIHCTNKKTLLKTKPDIKKVRKEFTNWIASKTN